MGPRSLFSGFLLLLLSSCAPKFVLISNPYELEHSITLIEQASSRTKQVRGSLDVKGTGLFGQFFHERADMVAKAPHYFLWSLRSFFESPAQLIASNGQYITFYDFSGQSASPYQKIPITPQSVVELFDVSFHPQSLINFFLNRIELRAAQNLKIMRSDGLWRIELDQDDGWHAMAFFDPAQEIFKEIQFSHNKRKLRYRVQYENIDMVNGSYFAKSLLVSVSGKQRSLKLSLEYLRLEVNGPEVEPENFFLKAH